MSQLCADSNGVKSGDVVVHFIRVLRIYHVR